MGLGETTTRMGPSLKSMTSPLTRRRILASSESLKPDVAPSVAWPDVRRLSSRIELPYRRDLREMAGKARSLGDQIINEETALEMAFRGETIDETDLRSRSRIAALWGVSQFDGKNAGWRPANIH